MAKSTVEFLAKFRDAPWWICSPSAEKGLRGPETAPGGGVFFFFFLALARD